MDIGIVFSIIVMVFLVVGAVGSMVVALSDETTNGEALMCCSITVLYAVCLIIYIIVWS